MESKCLVFEVASVEMDDSPTENIKRGIRIVLLRFGLVRRKNRVKTQKVIQRDRTRKVQCNLFTPDN